MEMRILGRTGEKVSVFGFGGIVVMESPQDEANAAVSEAIDNGINYFDVAPTYGNAQEKLGPALKPYRSGALLACKTAERDAAGARRELEKSLALLKTDYFDVYQIHGIDSPEEIDRAMAPGGALETILDAKKEGLVRFVGFSSHRQDAALKMLEMYDFDTVMFPFNWTYWLAKDIGPKLLETAKSRNMGIIAIKALAHRSWLENEEKSYPKCWYKPIFDNDTLAGMALRFILSRQVNVALSPGDIRMLRLGISIANRMEKDNMITDAEIEQLTAFALENDRFMW